MDTGRRVAVLVDGDNLSAAHAEQVFRLGANIGTVDVARVYGDAANNPEWMKAERFRFLHSGSGKNAADILLAIDAMDIVHEGRIKSVVLASSDSDFVHVAHRLRERSIHVIGAGESKASDRFRAACSQFKVLTVAPEKKPCAMAKKPDVPKSLDAQIRDTIKKHQTSNQGLKIVTLSAEMKKAFETRISTYPEKTWWAYLKARPDLFSLEPRGPHARVRVKS